MRTIPATAALAGGLLVLSAGIASAHYDPHHPSHNVAVQTIVVTVSCWRGPIEEVIWDRPEPIFIDSLLAVGYSHPEAFAIAQRVCRDPGAVNNPSVAQATMERILVEQPPTR